MAIAVGGIQHLQEAGPPVSPPQHGSSPKASAAMIDRLECMISETGGLLFNVASHETKRYEWRVEKGQTQLEHVWRPNRSRLGERREMVTACRALRMQIKKFEDDFIALRGHAPRGAERAPLASTYRQYREWKRDIRDHAASHIQAIVRAKKARNIVNRSRLLLRPPKKYQTSSDQIQILTNEKRKLKQQLKQYDQRFFELNGRMPTKAEKEPIRNLYEQYHDIKAKLIHAESFASSNSLPDKPHHHRSLSTGSSVGSGPSPSSSLDRLDTLASPPYTYHRHHPALSSL